MRVEEGKEDLWNFSFHMKPRLWKSSRNDFISISINTKIIFRDLTTFSAILKK
jgi:hypothetical protein